MSHEFSVNNYYLTLENQVLFKPIDFSVNAQEVVALTGASGSGKSTILADFLGVLPANFQSYGELTFKNKALRLQPLEQRKIGILFQDDLLFPHLNVWQNLVFGMPKQLDKLEKQKRIKQALAEAELSGFEKRDIATLSGGQRSRIALLRTLLSQPQLILLDEPFSKLDKALRGPFREWVFSHIAQLNMPTVLVTHDAEDIPSGSTTINLERPDA